MSMDLEEGPIEISSSILYCDLEVAGFSSLMLFCLFASLIFDMLVESKMGTSDFLFSDFYFILLSETGFFSPFSPKGLLLFCVD